MRGVFSARRHAFHVQAAIRERTQAVDKLASAETESGRLHLELAATLATAADNEVSMVVAVCSKGWL